MFAIGVFVKKNISHYIGLYILNKFAGWGYILFAIFRGSILRCERFFIVWQWFISFSIFCSGNRTRELACLNILSCVWNCDNLMIRVLCVLCIKLWINMMVLVGLVFVLWIRLGIKKNKTRVHALPKNKNSYFCPLTSCINLWIFYSLILS